LAIKYLMKTGKLAASPLIDTVAAISCGLYNGGLF
jgi:ribonuclease PH